MSSGQNQSQRFYSRCNIWVRSHRRCAGRSRDNLRRWMVGNHFPAQGWEIRNRQAKSIRPFPISQPRVGKSGTGRPKSTILSSPLVGNQGHNQNLSFSSLGGVAALNPNTSLRPRLDPKRTRRLQTPLPRRSHLVFVLVLETPSLLSVTYKHSPILSRSHHYLGPFQT